MTPAHIGRLWQIFRIYRKHRLGEFFERGPSPAATALAAGAPPPPTAGPARGERLRLALEELGPVFVKFGQALSTRPDLLPADVALELAKLQDRVPPFPGEEAQRIVERALGKPVATLFASFDTVPIASASVAQVHAARLHPQGADDPGLSVVVKVLRPDIAQVIRRDVELMYTLADLAAWLVPDLRRLRPREVVAEYERIIFDELDLMREGANCAQLRRNWLGSELIYHPIVLWDFTRPDVLVMERIDGISIRELDRLRGMGVDFKVLSNRGVEIFFKQVFRDNFFHADMHPGNIFVDTTDPRKPSYLAVDFGIVGTLTPSDQRYLAENFLAFFNRDYRRVAELHLDSQWIPAKTRVEEFEAAIRTVCEPIFGKPIKDISFGFFLMRLFQIARRFEMQVQPQLVLLQKTLLQVEGLGRQLDPELDLWQTAKPIMEEWMRNRLGPAAMVERARTQFPLLAETLPQLAFRAQRFFERSEGEHSTRFAIEHLREEMRREQRRTRVTLAAATLVTCGVLIYGLDGYRPIVYGGAPLLTWGLVGAGALAWLWLWWTERR